MTMSDIKDIDYFISGFKSKSEDVKLRVAREFKTYVVNDLKDKSREEMSKFLDKMFHEFIQMMSGNNADVMDKKAVLISLGCVVDQDFIISHNSFTRLSGLIQDLSTTDIQVSALQARFMALLNLISTAEKVDAQIKEACSLVVDDSKSEAQRLFAAFIFKEIAFFSSTVFYQHSTRVINSLLIGIRDKQASVREVCAIALAGAFSVTATREGISRRRQKVGSEPTAPLTSNIKHITSVSSQYHKQSNQQPANYARTNELNVQEVSKLSVEGDASQDVYKDCIKEMSLYFDDTHPSIHIDNRKLSQDAWNHGSLLLLTELLKLSNDEMEMNRLQLEHMIGLPMEQFSTSTLPPGILASRMACKMDWPHSNTEEHIIQHRAKIHISHSCRRYLQNNLDLLWQVLLHNLASKQPYLIQLVMQAIPRLIALDSNKVCDNERNQCLEFLNKSIKKDREKPLALLMIGLIAHAGPQDFYKGGHLDQTLLCIKQNLPSKDVALRKRQPLVDVSVYMLIGLLATGCGSHVHRFIKEIIEPIVEAGLSFPLIYSLKMVSCFITELNGDIHVTLLKSLRKILMQNSRHSPGRVMQLSSGPDNDLQLIQGLMSPLLMTTLSADQIEARNKILALRTLVEFDFDKHSLSLFVRSISSKLISFIICPYKEVRLEAVKTCAQLLTPLLGNDDGDHSTLTAVADVLEKLLIVSTSDPEAEVRLCVFQSFDERFDPYLAQEYHLSPLFIALHDENFEIRKLVIRCLGRLSGINPSCLKPSLRNTLLQLLTELEYSRSIRCKEQATQLLGELIDTAPGFIQAHSEQLLSVLLPRIQSIIHAAKNQSKDRHGTVFKIDNSQIKISSDDDLRGSEERTSMNATVCVESTGVQLAIIQAVKNLAVVCGNKLRRHLGELVPALIYMMQDSTSLEKRSVAVTTLTKLITHTGYVVEPYKRHPQLLNLLLTMLRNEEVGSIRREVIKLLGTIGALDPFKLKLFSTMTDSEGDIGLVVSMHDTIEKKEVDMSQVELLVNIPWNGLDEFFVACALQSLIQLLRDPSFRSHNDKICSAIILIFKTLGSKSVQYLKQVLPEYFRCILEAQDIRHQETLIGQLCFITDIVKLHLKQFMPQIVEILLRVWGKTSYLTNLCIKLLYRLNVGLAADMKPYLTPLISVFQETLSEAAEQSVKAMLELLPEFGHSLEEYIHIILGSIIKIISREDGGLRLESKKFALDCLTRLAETLDLSNFAGLIIQPVCRLLECHDSSTNPSQTSNVQNSVVISTTTITTEQLAELIPHAFDLLTTLLVKMRRRFMVLVPLVQRTLDNIKLNFPAGSVQSHCFLRFNTALNKVLKVSYICYHDDEFQNYESFATRRVIDNCSTKTQAYTSLEEISPPSHALNSVNLQRAWISNKMFSNEDWIQWHRNFSTALIKESPNSAIRSCSNISGCTAMLSKALFNASFVSCWTELTDSQQDEVIVTFENVLNDCNSTEISQIVLNLEEFMTHCDRMKLPISTSALAKRALRNRAYAKALYYKEQEFLEETSKKGLPPHDLLFELLTINNKLQLEEAATGVVIYATRQYRDKIINEERWHESLQDWTRALNLYERKIEENETRRTQSNELVLGRMRCLQALGNWNALKVIGIDKIQQSDENDRVKIAPMIVNAAWAIGDFNTMMKYVEYIPLNNFEGPFLRAVIAIHHEEFHEANDYIQRARDELDTYLTAMAGESYIRAYGDLVEAQKLAELEEVIQYKLVRESQETIRQAWSDRLKGCQQVIDHWRHLLQIRSLVLHPRIDMTTWLKFAGLARRSNRLDMSRLIMERLSGNDLEKMKHEDIAICAYPQITFAWAKYQWAVGQTMQAVDNLEVLVEKRLTEELVPPNIPASFQEQRIKDHKLLLAKCSLRLGDWYTEIHAREPEFGHYDSQRKIISAYKTATEEAPSLLRPWQAWAMANYTSICLTKTKIVEVTRQMNAIAKKWAELQPRDSCETRRTSTTQNNNQSISNNNVISPLPLPNDVLRMSQPQLRFSLLQSHQKRGVTSVSFPAATPQISALNVTFGQAMGVRNPSGNQGISTTNPRDLDDLPDDGNMLAEKYLRLDKQKKILMMEREAHSQPAMRGFVNAISLSANANLQDSLRLIILLFQFGHLPRIREVIREGLTKIKLDNWLLVMQQLLARIDTQKEHVSSIIVGLLITVGEKHPQAMVSPLALAFKSGGSDRRRYNANKILHSMETHSPRLVSEAFLLNEELIRLAISWMEMWTECLEDASRLFYEEKNVVAMFKILYPLHLLMEREIETLHEAAFYNEFNTEISNAKNLCVRYESSNYKTDLTQAWEIYSNLYRKWGKQISNLSTLELSVASPRLQAYNDWILAIPGSYDPNRAIVTVSSIKNCLNMMTSKQHPRKLTIVGSDGHNYMFLLKGHEDIRQDERAMQFFGLMNTLLVSNSQTLRRNLSIQRMSVIPLSTNTGLIGWVPNSDTLNAVVRDYREKMSMLLNKEHKEMLKVAPDFEKLNIIQKTEVFEIGIRESDGKDLAHILWLKSHNSEAWFERRTNFIRSLAVMSMVGYVLGLGDRHPSNIMLCRDSGKVIHIDFGDCFEVATMREKYPEKVPFRLTRMLIGAMEVTGIDGLFRHTCVQIINIMRRNRESLLAVLEAFIHDPLLQWVLHDSAKKNGDNAVESSETVHQDAVSDIRQYLRLPVIKPVVTNPTLQPVVISRNTRPSSTTLPILSDNVRIFTDANYPDSQSLRNPHCVNQWRHHLCNGPWLGCYNTSLKMRKRSPDGSIIVERNNLEGLIFSAKAPMIDKFTPDDNEDEWAGANVRAMDVMTHIQNKLEGKEAGGSLTADEHVDMLIKQATSNYNLCQMYFGWCAFW